MRHTSDHIAIDLVVLAVLRREDNIVLVRQLVGADRASVWVLPGGLVEAGELLTEGLVREVQEEAGVQVETIAHLACVSQIDRPGQAMQTLVYVFEVETWHGVVESHDPDAEVLEAALVPLAEAIERLRGNEGWPGIQTPMLAYLLRERKPGTAWFYRETVDGQHPIATIEN